MSQAPPPKRKCVILTLAQKICIIERLEADGGTKEYGVGNSTISDMKRDKEKIRAFDASQESSKTLIIGDHEDLHRC